MEHKEKDEDPSSKETDANFFKNFKDTLFTYIEQRAEIAKLTAVEKLALISGMISSALLILFFALMFLMFLSIMTSFMLNHYLNSYYLGFAWVTGFYLLMTILTLRFKKQVEKPIINIMIKMILKD